MRGTPRRLAAPVVLALVLAGAAHGGERGDRLDRFRELAVVRPGVAQSADGDAPADAYREVYALLDAEILESLVAGSPFASVAFIQDRLDMLAEAWSGSTFRLSRAGNLDVGAFVLDDQPLANSVRVYGPARRGPALLGALYGEGRPSVHAVTSPTDGVAILVAWEGVAPSRGARPLRVDVLRRAGDEMRVVWSTHDVFGQELPARGWTVRGSELRVRYELRYPGWAPGCEGQTEQEDVYRVMPGAVTRVSRRQFEPWHRELHAVVERLTTALAAHDEPTLIAVVATRALRNRLPAALRAEPACDAREGDSVSVAAAEQGRPWTLTFRRQAGGWRLTGAASVLQ